MGQSFSIHWSITSVCVTDGIVVVDDEFVGSIVVLFEVIVVVVVIVVVGAGVVVNSHDVQFALLGQSHTFMLSLKCNPDGQDLNKITYLNCHFELIKWILHNVFGASLTHNKLCTIIWNW